MKVDGEALVGDEIDSDEVEVEALVGDEIGTIPMSRHSIQSYNLVFAPQLSVSQPPSHLFPFSQVVPFSPVFMCTKGL
ncbi:hypothetical protein TSUD_49420 [Trifolium subterraneum]|uniref:Uncharacterized protein n=1 Tax=Trifolium subterraneum TaxID=3900 RepID=A0A2Z6M2S2_TRISU|nr:hypothetical protein TSUD_49420 [Trifolium subterraneum]